MNYLGTLLCGARSTSVPRKDTHVNKMANNVITIYSDYRHLFYHQKGVPLPYKVGDEIVVVEEPWGPHKGVDDVGWYSSDDYGVGEACKCGYELIFISADEEAKFTAKVKATEDPSRFIITEIEVKALPLSSRRKAPGETPYA